MKDFLIIMVIVTLFPFVFVGTVIRRIFESGRIKRGEHRILIIDNAKIGDIVCATPVFRAIKEKYPNSKIFALINPKTAGILKHNPRIDEIMPTDFSVGSIFRLLAWSCANRFTASVALVPGTMNYILPYAALVPIRSGATAPEYGIFYRILAAVCSTSTKRLLPDTLSVRFYLDLLGPLKIEHDSLKKEVYWKDETIDKARDFLSSNGWKPGTILVGFSATAGNKMKEWPIENFMKVAESIYRQHSFLPVFMGAPSDKEYIENALPYLRNNNVPYIVATSFSLEELPALISFFSYFISVDTGTLYIANAIDIPVLDIAGPCNIYDQMPLYEKCEVVYVKGLPGWPYSSVLRTVTRLTKEEMQCIEGISPQMVIESFRKLHAKYPPERDS